MRFSNVKSLLAWLRHNWLIGLIAGYELGALVVAKAGGPVCTIPCLYTALLGVHCPACGMTTAAGDLLGGDLRAAWDANPLVFLIAPLLVALATADFLRFRAAASAVSLES